jgi:hypothetical protein
MAEKGEEGEGGEGVDEEVGDVEAGDGGAGEGVVERVGKIENGAAADAGVGGGERTVRREPRSRIVGLSARLPRSSRTNGTLRLLLHAAEMATTRSAALRRTERVAERGPTKHTKYTNGRRAAEKRHGRKCPCRKKARWVNARHLDQRRVAMGAGSMSEKTWLSPPMAQTKR